MKMVTRKTDNAAVGELSERCDCICPAFACVLLVFSLGVGHCGVLNESEVVGDVLVVRKPPMGPNQAVLTNRHLKTVTSTTRTSNIKQQSFHVSLIRISTSTKPHHGVGAPLGDEGMRLILWHHGFNQRHSVTDALQHERETIKLYRGRFS